MYFCNISPGTRPERFLFYEIEKRSRGAVTRAHLNGGLEAQCAPCCCITVWFAHCTRILGQKTWHPSRVIQNNKMLHVSKSKLLPWDLNIISYAHWEPLWKCIQPRFYCMLEYLNDPSVERRSNAAALRQASKKVWLLPSRYPLGVTI